MSVDKYEVGKQKANEYAKMLQNKLKEYNTRKVEVQFFIDIEVSKDDNDKPCRIGIDYMEGDVVNIYFYSDGFGYANPTEEEINKLVETAKSIIE